MVRRPVLLLVAVLLGVDRSRWQDFREWSNDVTTLFGVRTPADLPLVTGRALPNILALRNLIDAFPQPVWLRDGARRAYSMANAPHDDAVLQLHLRNYGGPFSQFVFNTLKEKDILRAEGPYGSFFLREDSDKPIVLLASGTGFAPIKALIEHMQHQGITRPTTLYWGGRRPSDLYMADWLQTQLQAMPHLTYVPVISNAEAEDQWTGRTGFVHQAVLEDHPDLSGFQVYACGAPIVIESAQRDYVAKGGLPAEEFYADSFTSEADKAKA